MNLHVARIAVAAVALFFPAVAGAVIVNVDFNGQRDGESSPGTYVGTGAVGSGTTFNGILVNSTVSTGPNVNNDNITVTGSSLLDDTGNVTSVGFSLGLVGGDTTNGNLLGGDYIFNNSAGNTVGATGSAFTITGLGAATIADVYLYLTNGTQNSTIGGKTGSSIGTLNGTAIFLFDDVPVSGGSVSGTLGVGVNATIVMQGFTVDTTLPEPTTLGMLSVGAVGLLGRRRRA